MTRWFYSVADPPQPFIATASRSEGDVISAFIMSRCLVALVLVPLLGHQSSAKGGSFGSEHPYSPHHIEGLPPDIRNAIVQRCDRPKALHYFATYAENLQKVVLHFENFHCGTGYTFCGPSGCLHQIYVSSHGHYRLLRSYYAPAVD